MKGGDYLNHFVLPNFYFHLTAAYAILRHCGVESASATSWAPSPSRWSEGERKSSGGLVRRNSRRVALLSDAHPVLCSGAIRRSALT